MRPLRSASSRLRPAALLVLLPALAAGATAQTAHFSFVHATVGSGLALPVQTAVDASGNTYIADCNNGRVLKETRSVGGFAQTVVASGLTSPTGVAVDASGDVFIADSANNRILKEVPSGGGYTQSIAVGSGLSRPHNLAVDGGGRLYITDPGNVRVVIEAPSGGAFTQAAVITAGLANPAGIAVDTAGNVYVSDVSTQVVLKETPSGGSYVASTVASGSGGFAGVAVDAAGNVYIVDDFGNDLVKATPSGASYSQTTLINGLNSPQGIGVDLSGNFLAVSETGNNRVDALQLLGGDLGSQPVASPTTALSLQFTFDTGGELGSLPAVLTQGASGLDFADAGTGTCTTNGTSYAYIAGNTCTVDVTFNPAHPGPRSGAVELKASGGAIIATALIHGLGTGPQARFATSAAATALGPSFSQPDGISVDANDNLYVANRDSSVNQVVQLTAASGYATANVLGSGFGQPLDAVVDGAGNVFVTDWGHSAVKQILAPAYTTVNTLGAGFNAPEYLAVDGLGNVFVSDSGNGAVKEILAPAYTRVVTLASGINFPAGIALDSSGNVFFANSNGGTVEEILAPAYTTVTTLAAAGFRQPAGVAVDAAGNLYVADTNANTVQEIVASGGYATVAAVPNTATAAGLTLSVAADAAGNLFFIGDTNARPQELPLSTPPSLTFATTVVGNTSASQTVTVSNDGSSSLTLSNLGISSGFVQQSSGGTDCSATSVVASGASCNLQLAFQPLALGATSAAQATLADNNLNSSAATQSIPLSGDATYAPPTLSAAFGAASLAYGASTTLTFPIVNPNPGSLSGVAFTDTLPPGLVVATPNALASTCGGTTTAAASSSTVSLSGAALAANTSCQVALNVTAVTLGAQTNTTSTITAIESGVGSTASARLTVTAAALTITASSPSMIYGGAPPPITPLYSSFANGDSAASLTSAPVCLTSANSHSAAASPQTSSCSGAVDANYTFTYLPGAVTVGQAPLAITANNAASTYASALPTFTGTLGSTFNGDVLTETFSTIATASSGAGSYPIIPAVSGLAVANYAVTPTNGLLTIAKAALAVSAAPVSIAFGTAIPTLTPTYSGFVNGDTSASLTGAPALSTTATTSSNAGAYPITVAVGTLASSNYSLSVSNSTLTITPAPQTIAFNAIANQVFGAAPLTLTATSTSGLPVAFTLISGPATLTASTLTLTGGGAITVEADQPGNANYQSATAVRRTFTVAAPTLLLTPSALAFANELVSTPSAAQVVTVQNTGTASMAIASIAATGDFSQSNNCAAALAATASCAITVVFTPTAVGARAGALTVATTQAGSQSIALSGSGSDFSLTASGGTSQIIDGGQTATYTLALTPGSFTGTVALTCGVAPANVACATSPATAALTAGAPASSVTVTVATASRTAALPPAPPRPPLWPWLLLLVSLPVALWRRRHRPWMLGALAYTALFAAACGNGGVNNTIYHSGGTPPGTYSVTVTAAAGNVSQSVNLVLGIQ